MAKIVYWDEWNEAHIAEHNVTPEEAQYVVLHPLPGFPRAKEDGKFIVWGQTAVGRYSQVIFVYRSVATIDITKLDPAQLLLIENVEQVIYVIHARDLSDREKRQLRRSRR